ncbi:MAG: DUF2190 family protein [Phycisphaerae bacterium]|nr:DUF2190 family protein [Phycisphaerae bacterium]
MLQKNVMLRRSFVAGGAIAEGAIVKFGSDDDSVVVATAATDLLIGVASHDAASGERVEVDLVGITYVKLGGNVTRGNDITATTAGAGIALAAAATIKSSVGKAMASGSSGDLCPVMLGLWSAVTA